MEKQLFVMQNLFVFEVDRDIKSESFKEAIESGEVRITTSNITLMTPDGKLHEDKEDIEIIRQSLIYGMKEKG